MSWHAELAELRSAIRTQTCNLQQRNIAIPEDETSCLILSVSLAVLEFTWLSRFLHNRVRKRESRENQ